MRTENEPMELFLNQISKPEGAEKQEARVRAQALGLAGISLSPFEAQLVQNLVRYSKKPIHKALEIGTLTGLSALYWIELLEPTGQIWTLEKSPEHVQLARESLKVPTERGVCHLVEGDARESLPKLSVYGPFDFIFIDGNKAAYFDYWNWAEKNISPDGFIVVDNVFLSGAVYNLEEVAIHTSEGTGHIPPVTASVSDANLNTRRQPKFSAKQIQVVQQTIQAAVAHPDFLTTLMPTREGLLVAQRKT